MKEIVFAEDAQVDLDDVFTRIADRANVSVALAYTDRIRSYCQRLNQFPVRGVRREKIRPGLRTLGWRRRATIAFIIEEDRVVVLRILGAGRSIEKAFGGGAPE